MFCYEPVDVDGRPGSLRFSLVEVSHSLWKMRAWIMPMSRSSGGGGPPRAAVVIVQTNVKKARMTWNQNHGLRIIRFLPTFLLISGAQTCGACRAGLGC